MDATTKQKGLSGALVALLVGSVFVTAIPTAQATHASGLAPDAVVNTKWLHTDIVNITTANPSGTSFMNLGNVTFPAEGKLRHGSSYDLTFTNISTSVNNGYGFAASGTGLCLFNATGIAMANCRDLAADLEHIGQFNVTYPNQLLNGTGLWTLRDSIGTVVSTFLVWNREDLTVTLSASTFTYSESAVGFTVTVGGLEAGETALVFGTGFPVAGAVAPGPTGTYTFFGPLPEAGTFWVNATVNTGGVGTWTTTGFGSCGTVPASNCFAYADGGHVGSSTPNNLPERTGSTQYTVNAAGLVVTPVITSPKSGFTGLAQWNIKYPTGVNVFNHTVGNAFYTALNSYNLTVVGPGAWGTLWVNDTNSNPNGSLWYTQGGAAPAACTYNAGNATFSCGYNFVRWYYDNFFGNFTFSPNGTWNTGSFSFSLVVDKAGALAPEYSTAWTFTAATPADINLDLTGMASLPGGGFGGSSTITNLSVLESQGVGTTVVGPPGSYTLDLLITGNAQTLHPQVSAGGCAENTRLAGDAWTVDAKNITVTGDVIVLDKSLWTYTPCGVGVAGHATLPGIVPIRAPGHVVISVNWLNTTTSIDLPIVRGADLSATPTELVVDATSTVTFTLRDSFGNAVPDGKVFLYNKPSGNAATNLNGATSVNGTGAPGFGQNGQYTLTLTPGVVGKYIAYGIIGRQEGASDHRNFTYVEFNVVPAHDVTLTVTPTSTMASVTTAYMMNATIPDGRSLGTSGQIYLLNEVQNRDRLANFTLLATGQSTGLVAAVTGVNAQVNAAGGVTNYFFNATLTNGTYYVYICGNAGGGVVAASCTNARHDNNQSVPTITVNKFVATFSPDRIANSILVQANTTINVTVRDTSGTLWNGTLTYDATSTGKFDTSGTNGASPSIAIANGLGSFIATGNTLGEVAWLFDPAGSSTAPISSLATDNFEIIGPNITITPTRVPVGTTSTVAVSALSLTGNPLAGLDLKFCGIPISTANTINVSGIVMGCTENKTTDGSGGAQFGVFPTTQGNMSLVINGSVTRANVTAFAGLDVIVTPASPLGGDSVTLKIVQVGKNVGESGASVAVTRNGSVVLGFPQTTGASGEVVVPGVSEGTYAVTATKGSFEPGFTSFLVGPKPITPPPAAGVLKVKNVNVPATATVGEPITVSAELENTGTAAGTATLELLVNDLSLDSRPVTVAAGKSATFAFNFAPSKAGTFRITVRIAETGETLAEKTMTVTTPTVTTPVGSTPVGTTPVGTTPPATTGPTIPGFEVVALIGAIAAALIVLRRKA